MSSYETFRTDLITELSGSIPDDVAKEVIFLVDKIANNYDFDRKVTALTVVDEVPEAVRMYLAAKATENLTKGTLLNYFLALTLFFKTLRKPVSQIETNDVRLYLYNYKATRKVTDRTLDHIRIQLNSFFEWCKDEDLVTKNPVTKIQSIKYSKTERHKLSSLELEHLRFACRTLREKAVIDFLYSTGCRVSELCAMNLEDVDWNARSAKVLHGKGDKQRTVYLNAECIISLQAYLSTRSDDCPALIVNDRSTEKHRIQKKSIENMVKSISERSGLPFRVKPHELRHTFATMAIRNGMPVEQVQRILGHSKLETTMIYAAVDDSDVKRNHQRCVI